MELNLWEEIKIKQEELERLVATKKTIRDEEVYRKSLELDDLVVQVMRKKIGQIDFKDTLRA
ncbi:MAG TPA: Spo0E family sporulation regulatory protein-aspartic acid phosphatase [Clostridia bacterium]|nr:Spo0E family sporulation regulatory protein-aspartic acid phosphatase [Clostridia bacterium]